MRRSSRLVGLLCVLLGVASPVAAQGTSGLSRLLEDGGVGATVGWVFPTDSGVDVGTVLGFQFGLAPRPGWGPSIGFGWFGANLLLGGQNVGNLNVKPLMAGVGYTWMSGRVAASVAVNAGVSFNSASIDQPYREAFGPGTTVDLSMKNSFCVRPSVEVDYMAHRKLALTAWAGYWWTRIDSTLTTPAGVYHNEWNPSSLSVAFGFMVYPFR